MASRKMSREEGLKYRDCKHACHVMLYCDTRAYLFGKIPIRNIILMQMRFDGQLGFHGGIVNPSREKLEDGLMRELSEELGLHVQISEKHYVESSHHPRPSSPGLITHFYVKKMEEKKLREVETAAVFSAEHGQEVMGMVRVPLYTMKGGGGLPRFLTHSFIGNARSQLMDQLQRLHMVSPEELQEVLAASLRTQQENGEKLQAEVKKSRL